ncbi:hypothetical protein [Bartonella krasnovii]|uniref:Uncharacterized protein n=1 Tax=Bartonella krasnovii TaxID=2267275 RepID=A0A5B9CZI6_9HYPH|nr:hypothetical protein [Bartonella krasnovii]QEE11733.1 hypothetical protein D1092_01625 [Bartonella krasnovii]UNF29491.1 hypothetical protein MNL13_01570 [Bartonella krasnovii]UNF35849.1 hypothetical protein MNL12_01570 [Bartonella krasnovii]UNF37469.1 hypothetical protein MNL11_01575 [Bartonella krasnovii]UNF39253.1 hypothetical protein MNL10_02085 [Bartonella krasnovii]
MMKKVLLFVIIVAFLGADSVMAAGCAEVGKRVATQEKGVLVRSKLVVQDGRDMCAIVVVIPARNGEKLRRVEAFVPAG